MDDSAEAGTALAAVLRVHGHPVAVARDGRSALTLARGFAPEVVLLDIELPGMSGLDVARQLRAMPGHGDTVLIALTGYGSPADRARAREAGFDHHFTKPLALDALLRLLADRRPATGVREPGATGDSRTD